MKKNNKTKKTKINTKKRSKKEDTFFSIKFVKKLKIQPKRRKFLEKKIALQKKIKAKINIIILNGKKEEKN